MSRAPIVVYRALIQTQLNDSIPSRIQTVVDQFSGLVFAGQDLSSHLTQFVGFCSRLAAHLDGRDVTESSDLTLAIDVLDHFASTSKWWTMTRQDPSLVIRPPSHDSREFIKSASLVHLGGDTLGRITGSVEKLSRFLEDQGVTDADQITELCETMVAVWALLSAFICKNLGRSATSESDFESAYDVTRVLLFYVSYDDLRALTAIRRLATSTIIPKAAEVCFSPASEKRIESSLAGQIEAAHVELLSKTLPTTPSATRAILTNSLRFLMQLQAARQGIIRIEEEQFDSLVLGTMDLLDKAGISPNLLQNEQAVGEILKSLKPDAILDERMSMIGRRLESLIADSAGSREFLLQHSRLVPRLTSLLLFLALGTKKTKNSLTDSDVKRAIILTNRVVSGW